MCVRLCVFLLIGCLLGEKGGPCLNQHKPGNVSKAAVSTGHPRGPRPPRVAGGWAGSAGAGRGGFGGIHYLAKTLARPDSICDSLLVHAAREWNAAGSSHFVTTNAVVNATALWLWAPGTQARGEGVCVHVCWGRGEALRGRGRRRVINRLEAPHRRVSGAPSRQPRTFERS